MHQPFPVSATWKTWTIRQLPRVAYVPAPQHTLSLLSSSHLAVAPPRPFRPTPSLTCHHGQAEFPRWFPLVSLLETSPSLKKLLNHRVSFCLKIDLQDNNTGIAHFDVQLPSVIKLASSINYCKKCTGKLVHLLYESHSQAVPQIVELLHKNWNCSTFCRLLGYCPTSKHVPNRWDILQRQDKKKSQKRRVKSIFDVAKNLLEIRYVVKSFQFGGYHLFIQHALAPKY